MRQVSPRRWGPGCSVAGSRQDDDGATTLKVPRINLMNTIHLTDEELEMARQALRSYLLAFGHDEADTHRTIWRVLGKLDAAEAEGDEPQAIA